MNLPSNQGVFSERLKILLVTTIYKHGDESLLTNYRPISVLPCFTKLLGHILYNRIYNFLVENEIPWENQFYFQPAKSTEHAILQLENHIVVSFNPF